MPKRTPRPDGFDEAHELAQGEFAKPRSRTHDYPNPPTAEDEGQLSFGFGLNDFPFIPRIDFTKNGKRAREPRKPGWQITFLKHLSINGIVGGACYAAGISRQHAYRHRRESPDFAEAWDEAVENGIDNWEALFWKLAVEEKHSANARYILGVRRYEKVKGLGADDDKEVEIVMTEPQWSKESRENADQGGNRPGSQSGSEPADLEPGE